MFFFNVEEVILVNTESSTLKEQRAYILLYLYECIMECWLLIASESLVVMIGS